MSSNISSGAEGGGGGMVTPTIVTWGSMVTPLLRFAQVFLSITWDQPSCKSMGEYGYATSPFCTSVLEYYMGPTIL